MGKEARLRALIPGPVVVAAGIVCLAAFATPDLAVPQEDRFERDVPRGVPEHYAATEVYVQGEIVEVLDGGFTLLLDERTDEDLFGPFGDTGGGASPGQSFDSFIGIGAEGLTIVQLGSAQGWLFFDDPDGGPQRRIRLIEGRDLLRPGYVIQVGRAPGRPSSASHAPVSAQGRTGRSAGGSSLEFRTRKRVAIEGWVFVRLNAAGTEEESG